MPLGTSIHEITGFSIETGLVAATKLSGAYEILAAAARQARLVGPCRRDAHEAGQRIAQKARSAGRRRAAGIAGAARRLAQPGEGIGLQPGITPARAPGLALDGARDLSRSAAVAAVGTLVEAAGRHGLVPEKDGRADDGDREGRPGVPPVSRVALRSARADGLQVSSAAPAGLPAAEAAAPRLGHRAQASQPEDDRQHDEPRPQEGKRRSPVALVPEAMVSEHRQAPTRAFQARDETLPDLAQAVSEIWKAGECSAFGVESGPDRASFHELSGLCPRGQRRHGWRLSPRCSRRRLLSARSRGPPRAHTVGRYAPAAPLSDPSPAGRRGACGRPGGSGRGPRRS